MSENEITRRDFLRAAAATAIGVALAGCAKTATEAPTATPRAAAATATPTPKPAEAKEIPMLASKVEADELPPMADRLPMEPRVVKPFEAIGKYGGTLRMGDFQENRHAINSFRVLGLLGIFATPKEDIDCYIYLFKRSNPSKYRCLSYKTRVQIAWRLIKCAINGHGIWSYDTKRRKNFGGIEKTARDSSETQ